MWSPISCVLPSLGRSGPSRAEVGFRFVRLVGASVLPPPPLVLFRVRRPPLSFSLALSGFARSGPGVLVCVFSFPLLLRSPPEVPVKYNHSSHFHSHLIFIPLSSSSSPHCKDTALPKAGCVCVCVRACTLLFTCRKLQLDI